MTSTERRLQLMLMIQGKGKRKTVQEYADHFGVSKRTIFRDLNALEKINVPITWDKYTGYGVMPGYKIPPLMFTTQELATIIIGLNFVKSQVDLQMVRDAKGVEVKIKNVLPGNLKELMDSLQNNTIIDPYKRFGEEKKEGGNWYLLSSAISQKKRVQFFYDSISSKKEIRKIDPYILVYFEDHWNIIGFSHLRGDIRNFILDRMSDVKIIDENFIKKEKTSIEGLIFRSDELSREIILEVDNKLAERLESILPAKIIKKNKIKSKKFNIHFEFNNLHYINEWLLQFGNKIKIKAPKELIEIRRNILNNMLSEIE